MSSRGRAGGSRTAGALSALLVVLASTACEGNFSEVPRAPVPESIPKVGARRLTRAEYDNTVRDILGDTGRDAALLLPADQGGPFDNDYESQVASQALIDGLDVLSQRVVSRLLADAERTEAVVGCTPAAAGDADCFRAFVSSVGRRLFRRALTGEEVARFAALQSFSVEAVDFNEGMALVLRAMLQHPAFLYRIERGTTLDNFEIASRLSYFLWASAPDDVLLGQAERGELTSAEGRQSAARRLLLDQRGSARVHDFFSHWLGYATFRTSSPDLTQAMGEETTALVDQVILTEKASLLDLFRSGKTWVSPMLAEHYGLPPVTGEGSQWVPYSGAPRQGILSHGSILAAGAKFGDTSPTIRGKLIRNRLLCTEIPKPPADLLVNVDEPPTGGHCKSDRYKGYQTGVCRTCHSQMDPVGFGLERYDAEGRYRTQEAGLPECPIPGTGEVVGLGTFSGPAGLSETLIESGQLQQCAVTQVFRLAFGRRETPADGPFLDAATARFKGADARFHELLLQIVGSEAFVSRKEEE